MADTADSRRRGTVVLIAFAAFALAVVIGVLVAGGADDDSGDGQLSGPGDAFTLDYPDNWSARSSSELAELGQQPLAVLDREDDTALLTIRREPGGAPPDLERFAKDLDRELPERFDDFRRVGADVVELDAGRAFSYSFARTRAGSAHRIVLVPAPEGEAGSYVMDGIVRAGEDDAARELDEIVRSFGFPEEPLPPNVPR